MAAADRVFGVKVRVEFSAAHHIRGYDGDCARPHGHNYKVEVDAAVRGLDGIGLALDFKDLKRLVNSLVARFDHQDINTVPPFTDVNPTAETMARYFFEELERLLEAEPAGRGVHLRTVTIWESERSAASFGIA